MIQVEVSMMTLVEASVMLPIEASMEAVVNHRLPNFDAAGLWELMEIRCSVKSRRGDLFQTSLGW